jgi:hypothetical protein
MYTKHEETINVMGDGALATVNKTVEFHTVMTRAGAIIEIAHLQYDPPYYVVRSISTDRKICETHVYSEAAFEDMIELYQHVKNLAEV